MDNSYGIGYRSPCVSLQQYQGSTSPAAQGRSVREFEEQMATLRKENFNLKLRLYFIEESIPGYQQANSPDGQETLMKQLIDTKVEIEILRKEIQEKQEILKEAAQAMNQMERIQKETEAKSQAAVDELNQKIQYMEMEKEMEKSQNGEFMNELLGRSDISENINAIQRIRELEGLVKQSEEKLNHFQDQISELDEILLKRDETIKEYEEKVKELVFQNAELLEALENKDKEVNCAESQRLREELQEQKLMLADKTCMLLEAEEQLQTRTKIHEKACRTIQSLMNTVTSQKEEMKKMIKNASMQHSTDANKEQVHVTSSGISGYDYSGVSRSMSDTEASNTLLPGQKIKYEATIAQQEALICSLKSEVKKKTANLQNLVNKELWEKNREIERLTKLIGKNEGTNPSQIVSPSKNTSANELQQSFSETEYLKALERNKLLQKKVDILMQRLEKNRDNDALTLQLRNDVSEARKEAELAEKWRRDCMDVCSVLSNRLEELAYFLNSLLKHKDLFGMLAADRRKAMRKAVDRSLDLSKSLNMRLSLSGVSMIDQNLLQISNLSEILGDDVVELENNTFNSHESLQAQVQSIETLKAENKALKQELDQRRFTEVVRRERRSLPLGCIDNQSDSEAWSEPDRKVSMARIGLDDHSPTKSSPPVTVTTKVVNAETDSESEALKQSRSSKTAMPAQTRHVERIAQLEQLIVQRDDRILEIQCQLVDADSRLKMENLKVMDMTHELEHLRQRNEELNADLLAIGSDETLSEHNRSILQQQIDEKTRLLEKIQEERDQIAVKAHASELEIARLQKEIKYMEQNHESLMNRAQRQELQKLEKLKSECNVVLEARLATQQQQHVDALARDWIARKLYEESQQQLKKLQSQLKETQNHIEYLQENEEEMKKSLMDSELATRAIKKQLDESTLQASKAILERTRALHDKLELEKRVQELTTQLKQQESQRNSMRCQIKELEGLKSELQQQLNAAQEHALKVQGSDGYTSEEVPHNGAESASGGSVPPQRLNNSSPDLGIESDAGRVHSMEQSNTEHKMLNAIELLTADNQESTLKDVKVQINQDVKRNVQINQGQHDCAKVDQEIAELQRKLIRTKRALIDAYEQIRDSNQKKAQVEKNIKNEILKTNNVLKKVRSNMENQS